MKEAGRDSVEAKSCLINTAYVRIVCVTCIIILVITWKSGSLLGHLKYNNTRQYKKK